MASSTLLAAPSSPVAANTAPPPAATTMEPKTDAGLLALACSGSFHDLESLLNGTPAAYTLESSAAQPPALYAVTFGGDTLLHVIAASHGDSEDLLNKANLVYGKAPSLLFVQNKDGETPLHCAARTGNFPMVSLLIDVANGQGINNAKGLLETQNKLKETALHEAVRIENNDMVNLLMTHDPELATLPVEGTSPLYFAILLENGIIAKTLYELSAGFLSYSGSQMDEMHCILLFSGAKVTLADLTQMLLAWNNDLTLQGDKNGSTPLHFAIVASLRQMRPQVLIALADALYQQDHDGSFPTHVAASVGATSAIAHFLRKSPNCAGLRDARGRTFLHVAVDKMKIGTVDYACRNISLSWILNMQDKDGNTALHLAVRKGSLRMFCSLLGNRQVHLNLLNEKGLTPLDIAHHNLPEGLHMRGETRILKALKYVNTKRGFLHQVSLNEYDIDQARQDEMHISNQVKEGTRSQCIGAVLIATMTFGATFTMPGGYRADEHNNAGSPTLAGTFMFNAFIMTNTLAFAFSAISIINFIITGSPTLPNRRRLGQFQRASSALYFSLVFLMAAFALATYMMLAPVAPVAASAVTLISVLVMLYPILECAIMSLFLFTALCKRKGVCYGIVWAKPFAAVIFVKLIFLLLLAFVLALPTHTSGGVEPPAQPPTRSA